MEAAEAAEATSRLIPLFLSPLLVIVGDESLYAMFGDGFAKYNVWVSIGFHLVNLQTIVAGGLVVLATIIHLHKRRDTVRFRIVKPK